jgi:putative ATPase
MKQLGYGKDYQYDHAVEGGVALDQQCLPERLAGTRFYRPTARGMEGKIREKVEALRAARAAARGERGDEVGDADREGTDS